MKSQYFILLSALSLSACTAHIGHHDIGAALRSGLSGNQSASAGYAPQKPSARDCAFHATARAAQEARSSMANFKNRMAAAKRSLSQSPAWQNGSCIRPAMRSLPPQPKSLSQNEIEFQAVGFCMDTAMRRQSANDLMQALVAVRKEKLLDIGTRWRNSPQQQCALSVSPPQMNDFVARAVCGAFGREAYSDCVMKTIYKCVETVAASCEAPLAAWKQNVEAIQNEPDVLLQQCQSNISLIEEAERRIPEMEMTAHLNQEEHDKLAASGGAKAPASACY
ncbi:MAG: hypothetical protein KJ017_05680 [Alphaproteobacteria bacterium]|nr:hypothetical protein [Alphaproteobacteria bacterium]